MVTVSSECPTCAAPLDFAHGSKAIRCEHCRTNLLVTGHKQVLSYHVAPRLDAKGAVAQVKSGLGSELVRLDDPRLYFIPYYWLTGHEFRWVKPPAAPRPHPGAEIVVGESVAADPALFQDRYIDRSFLALDLPELGVPSLGVRTSVLRLQLFRKSALQPPGRSVSVEMATDAALYRGMEPTDPTPILHRAVLGRVLSVVYFPFWIVPLEAGARSRLAVVDAVAETVATLDAGPSLLARLEREPAADPAVVGFRPLVCPNCGWDLALRPDDVVFSCRQCDRAWQIAGEDVVAVESAVADLPQMRARPAVTYLPCWVLDTDAAGLTPSRFFSPAFRFQRLRFVSDLARRLSAAQPSYAPLVGPRPELHGGHYDVEDAILLARFVQIGVAGAGAGAFGVRHATLTWFPFSVERNELIDPFTGLALPGNLLL